MTVIGWCIPTIPRRRAMLHALLDSLPFTGRVYVHEDSASCGAGWQAAGDRAYEEGCDYLALLADDLEWCALSHHFIAKALAARVVPAPYLIHPDGREHRSTLYMEAVNPASPAQSEGLEVGNVPFPILNRELWEAVQPIPPFGHFCDNWVTEKARAAGYTPRLVTAYRLVHKIVTTERPGEFNAYIEWRTRL